MRQRYISRWESVLVEESANRLFAGHAVTKRTAGPVHVCTHGHSRIFSWHGVGISMQLEIYYLVFKIDILKKRVNTIRNYYIHKTLIRN